MLDETPPPSAAVHSPGAQSSPSTIEPTALDTAVDRLLEATGLSARRFLRMLEDRSFVRNVESYRDAQVELHDRDEVTRRGRAGHDG